MRDSAKGGEPAEPWRAFLAELDTRLTTPVELVVRTDRVRRSE